VLHNKDLCEYKSCGLGSEIEFTLSWIWSLKKGNRCSYVEYWWEKEADKEVNK